MTKLPRQTTLFDILDDVSAVPALKGRRCKKCGFIMFPPQDYGCERCGGISEDLEHIELNGRGVLKSFVIEHRYPSRKEAEISVVGEVLLAQGPVVKAMIDCHDESELIAGKKVYGVLIADGEDKDGIIFVDYYFAFDGE